MQDGRKVAARKARRAAVARVLAFRKWLDEDATYWAQYNRWLETGTPVKAKRPPVPALPSASDYEIAREEGHA